MLFRPKVEFKSDDFMTEQVFYTSKDGTRIPMFLTYRKGLKKDGNNPTLLYGYGGFDSSVTPELLADRRDLAANGRRLRCRPTCAAAASTAKNGTSPGRSCAKQNVFDDFIAAGEWLIENKYTSTPKLAISGRQQRRASCRRRLKSAARSLGRDAARGRRDGHAALPEVHDRLGLDLGLRLVR